MKKTFLLAAALFLGAAAQAQTAPTSPQRGGSVNQATVPPPNPANPVANPGTIDQRTPTQTSPTRVPVLGTIDERPPTDPIKIKMTPEGEIRSPAPVPRTSPATTPRNTKRPATPPRP